MTRESDALDGDQPRGSADRRSGKSSRDNDIQIGAPVRVSKLDSLRAVRAELGRLYRECRRREGRYPDALTAFRLASVLGAVARSIELEELEQRLVALERRAESDVSR